MPVLCSFSLHLYNVKFLKRASGFFTQVTTMTIEALIIKIVFFTRTIVFNTQLICCTYVSLIKRSSLLGGCQARIHTCYQEI